MKTAEDGEEDDDEESDATFRSLLKSCQTEISRRKEKHAIYDSSEEESEVRSIITSRMRGDAPSFVRRSKLWVMVDGEFGGPVSGLHPDLAWAVVVFKNPADIEFQRARRPFVLDDVILDGLSVRIHPEKGTKMHENTVEHFFMRPSNAKLCAWLCGGATPNSNYSKYVEKGIKTPKEAANMINSFLKRWAKLYDLRFIAKPASIDIARLQHFLRRQLGPSAFSFHHSTRCLLTMMDTIRGMIGSAEKLNVQLRSHREANRRGSNPSHFPLDDCIDQITDFVYLRFLQNREVVAKKMMMNLTATPHPLHMCIAPPNTQYF